MPYIDEKKLRTLLDERIAFRLAHKVFSLISKKKTQMPPKIYLTLSAITHGLPTNDFRAMPAFIDDKKGGACGIKWVSVFPENRRLKQPTVCATILLNSPKTGVLLSVLEANHITAIRTGAAAALATHCLANPRPRKLAIIGAGLQGGYQLKAIASLYTFQEIGVWGFLSGESDRFCQRFLKQFPQAKSYPDIKNCVDSADIIVTCTPSRKPLLMKEWVKKGAHINAMGADAKGKQELDPKLLLSSRVIVDERRQASHSGEINVPISRGLYSEKKVYAELSEIVSGKKKGRTSRGQITLFDSTGLAVLDIYFAQYVYDQLFRCQKKS
ncbi:MAG: hypothetical protein AUJ72_00250 [Candidatus Omnitrophica bacterium CG1_02_46_14]|nr:MAG: hypothetical protein AUJ72_00250 [Candidatus Omnitrophica bacterium CG1_02_46_14]